MLLRSSEDTLLSPKYILEVSTKELYWWFVSTSESLIVPIGSSFLSTKGPLDPTAPLNKLPILGSFIIKSVQTPFNDCLKNIWNCVIFLIWGFPSSLSEPLSEPLPPLAVFSSTGVTVVPVDSSVWLEIISRISSTGLSTPLAIAVTRNLFWAALPKVLQIYLAAFIACPRSVLFSSLTLA